MTLDLTIVIVNYNTHQLLLNCLDSIYSAISHINMECIVVDNVSIDGSVEAVHAQFPQVRVIANRQNVYFSAGNNQGITEAQGRYVLALNPDTVIQGNTLDQLIKYMDNHPEVGAATTCMYFPDGKLQRNGARHVTWGYLVLQYTVIGKLLWGRTHTYNDWLWYADWGRRTEREIDVLPGSCIIASRELWRCIGGFDARMLMYFSDDYFSLQVKQHGKKTMYIVTDGIIHYEGQSAKQVSARALQLYFHDLLVYTRLVFGPVAQILLMVLLIPTWIVQRLKARWR